MSKYDRLRELLGNESFPHIFPFRFVGKNTESFRSAVKAIEGKFPELGSASERLSKGDRHLAMGWSLNAKSVEEIIEVFEAISGLPDLVMIL